MAIRLRVRGPGGAETIQAEDDWTIGRLVELIREKMGVQQFSLKAGFPPVPLDLNATETRLEELKLGGATLTLVPAETEAGRSHTGAANATVGAAAAPPPPVAAPPPVTPFTPRGVEVDETVVEWPEGGGYLSKSSIHPQDLEQRPNPMTQCSESCPTTTAACSQLSAGWWVFPTLPPAFAER